MAYACPSMLLMVAPVLCSLGLICLCSITHPELFDTSQINYRTMYLAPGICGTCMFVSGFFYYPFAGKKEIIMLFSMQAIGMALALLYAGVILEYPRWLQALTVPTSIDDK